MIWVYVLVGLGANLACYLLGISHERLRWNSRIAHGGVPLPNYRWRYVDDGAESAARRFNDGHGMWSRSRTTAEGGSQ